MNFLKLKETDTKYITNIYNRYNVAFTSGIGAKCTDINGKEYIDFSSGIGVNSLGFSNPVWLEAVTNQLNQIVHTSNLYYTLPAPQLAELLCEKTGTSNVFFANSGAEANEGAIKAARKYSADKYGDDRYEIVSLVNSFHGRTITTLSATGQEVFHKHFDPFTKGFNYAQANDFENLLSCITPKTCGIMLELIQGEGGVLPLEQSFIDSIVQLCKEKDILLIVDEVQTGVGRTGKFLCCQHYNIQPDIITLAKGLGNGLPIGAVLFGSKTKDVLGFSDHGTTFGGNPVACAGGVAVVNYMTPQFLREVTQKGDKLKTALMGIPQVVNVTGLGLMLGVTLAKPFVASEVVGKLLQEGIVALTAKDKLRLLPPLIISEEEIDICVSKLAKVLGRGNI